jgi:hypothetical protein
MTVASLRSRSVSRMPCVVADADAAVGAQAVGDADEEADGVGRAGGGQVVLPFGREERGGGVRGEVDLAADLFGPAAVEDVDDDAGGVALERAVDAVFVAGGVGELGDDGGGAQARALPEREDGAAADPVDERDGRDVDVDVAAGPNLPLADA